MVTDDQRKASVLNKQFSSVFNTVSGADKIDASDINTNDVTSSALVDSQDATTEINNNSNGGVSNNNENSHGLH